MRAAAIPSTVSCSVSVLQCAQNAIRPSALGHRTIPASSYRSYIKYSTHITHRKALLIIQASIDSEALSNLHTGLDPSCQFQGFLTRTMAANLATALEAQRRVLLKSMWISCWYTVPACGWVLIEKGTLHSGQSRKREEVCTHLLAKLPTSDLEYYLAS